MGVDIGVTDVVIGGDFNGGGSGVVRMLGAANRDVGVVGVVTGVTAEFFLIVQVSSVGLVIRLVVGVVIEVIGVVVGLVGIIIL